MVEVGVNIRKRFLEQERVSPQYGLATKASMKRDITDMGHGAAHCGNLVADRAMFKAGLISSDYDTVFWSLYRVGDRTIKPQNVQRTPPSLIKALNCSVTAKAGPSNPQWSWFCT